jgi:cyclopropane fatty-acyl-phospholipid synthase-like methyltransferase
MTERLSPRLLAVVDALPLRPGLRVLEIGCGPGAAAREVARRIGSGFVLGIDRSARAVAQANAASTDLVAAGTLAFRQAAIETFTPSDDDPPFDLALAVRVGALDGRHPQLEEAARTRIAAAMTPSGRAFIDGGDPLRALDLRG